MNGGLSLVYHLQLFTGAQIYQTDKRDENKNDALIKENRRNACKWR